MPASSDNQRDIRKGLKRNKKIKTEIIADTSNPENQTVKVNHPSKKYTEKEIGIFFLASIGYLLIFVSWNAEHSDLRDIDTKINDRINNSRLLIDKGIERDMQEFKAIQNNNLYAHDSSNELLAATFDAYLNYCQACRWLIVNIAGHLIYKPDDASICSLDSCQEIMKKYNKAELNNIAASNTNLVYLKQLYGEYHSFDSGPLMELYQCFLADGKDELNEEQVIVHKYIYLYFVGSLFIAWSYVIKNGDKLYQLFYPLIRLVKKDKEPQEKVTGS